MMTHPDETTLARWLDGEADDAPRALTDHLAGCDYCQERLALLTGEASDLRAALAFTGAELDLLFRADLPGRLIATVAANARPAFGSGPLHLLILFGVSLAVALVWATLDPVVGPVIGLLSRGFDLTTLTLTVGSRAFIQAAGAIVNSPLAPAGLLASNLLAVVAGAMLLGLWLYRLRPLTAAEPAS
jgi:hypothetical protein